ncbi:50S ribosomal protein L13 [Candidatus Roizmanbacteria bacterium CG_4_10_14_0_2_um_filter_36_9]|uniref:Large ribosomal subunit protein uL13 n=2 Tax=Candidatus Roizmaniibacteriota TaxID=1752723 RepID=A0A2M7U438_9BACT|nr:MAG: 50S ribosomal protein L13 [Candidatus Roizmanbacteria bacterium CG_4_10_14_0_2_um_filter_36_9]
MVSVTTSTRSISQTEVERKWHLIDLKNVVLGRSVTQMSRLLQGKDKRNFVPYLDAGDHVVVINAAKVKVTGKKEDEKEYDQYSGYQGGRKVETFKNIMLRDPEKIIRHAVSGMLPKNKHRDPRLARLHVYPGENYPYADKFKSNK